MDRDVRYMYAGRCGQEFSAAELIEAKLIAPGRSHTWACRNCLREVEYDLNLAGMMQDMDWIADWAQKAANTRKRHDVLINPKAYEKLVDMLLTLGMAKKAIDAHWINVSEQSEEDPRGESMNQRKRRRPASVPGDGIRTASVPAE